MKKRRFYYRITSFLMAALLVVTSADLSVFAAEDQPEIVAETDAEEIGVEEISAEEIGIVTESSAEETADEPDGGVNDGSETVTGNEAEAQDGAADDAPESDTTDVEEEAAQDPEAEAAEEMDETLFDMSVEVGDLSTGYKHYPGDDQVAIVGGGSSGYSAYGSSFEAVPATLPASYKTPKLPALRDQNPYGSCWSFTSMSMAEVSRMKAGIAAPDYSELALCYFTYKTVEDPLGGTAGDWNTCKSNTFMDVGGNLNFSGPVLANWVGATDEALAPYTDDGIKKAMNGGLDSKLAYNDKAHLVGYYKADIKDDRDTVKRLIYSYGAVGASMYAYTYLPNYAYSDKYNSYYVKSAETANHAVTIVGWDDTFPKENFVSTADGDGAWLVRNSWWSKNAKEESYFGYFWLSYYDKGLSNDAHAFEFAGADNYQHNYQYDGAMQSLYVGGGDRTEGANVFTAKACEKGEQIRAASFLTGASNVQYTVKVYTNLADPNNPTSGALWDTVTGTTTCEGYYTVPFNNPVTVAEGDTFAIVVTLEKPGGVSLGSEYAMSYAGWWYQTCTKALPGQSFMWNGVGWYDFGKLNNANLRIKAFTNDSDGSSVTVPYVRISGVDEIYYGESANYKALIFPQNTDTSTLKWTSSDPSVAAVDNTGKLTVKDVGTITLSVEVNGLTASQEVRCIPHAPEDATGSVADGKVVTLQWKPVPEAEYYIITNPYGANSERINASGLGTCSYTDHSLAGDEEIYLASYKITAYRKGIGSSRSVQVYVGPSNGIIYDVGAGANNASNPKTYEKVDQITLLDPTPPVGYTFGGWYTEAEYLNRITRIDGTKVDGVLYLYARYVPNTYHIKYSSNYGRGNQETTYMSGEIKYDLEYEIIAAESILQPKAGYTFLRWNTKPDGSGTDYLSGQNVIKLTAENDACIDLYAQWNFESEVYEVTFDACGGNVHPSSKLVKSGTRYGKLPTPEKDGLVFEGWYLSRKYLSEEKIDEDTIAELEADCTVYARYRETAGDVMFRVDLTEDGKVVPDSKLFLSAKLAGTKIFYTLDGSVPDASTGGSDGSRTKYYDDAIILAEDLAGAGRLITVNAIAVKQGCDPGTVKTMTYELLDESKNWGDITEEVAGQEGIDSAEDIPKGFWLTGVKASVPYTGKARTFDALGVYFGKTRLQVKKDYTVKYANNKNVGTARITITGKGNYTGRLEKTFEINKLDIQDAEADDIVLQYSGKAQKGSPVVVYEMDGKPVTLKAGRDYTYDDAAYTEIGEYAVVIRGKGNFTGELSVRARVTNCKPMSKLSYSIKGNSCDQGNEPTMILVKDGQYELKAAKIKKTELNAKLLMAMGSMGYDCVYYLGNNEQAGNASIVFVGTGREQGDTPGYAGTARKTYKLDGIPVGSCTFYLPDDSKLVYSGEVMEPEILVSSGSGQLLKRGTDYTISYSNTGKVGKAKATVRGIGKYKGSKAVPFQIKPCRLSAVEGVIVGNIADVPYTKNFTKPTVNVTRIKSDGKLETLVEGKDYKIICKNNKKANTVATAVIQGIGNYTGAVGRNFLIVKGNLADAKASSKDLIYQMKGGLYKKASVSLTDTNGVKMKAGRDYKITEYQYACDTQGVKVKDASGLYSVDHTKGRRGAVVDPNDILPVGAEIKAVLTSCSDNYEGEAEVVFRVVKNDISKAKVTVVQKQEYTPGRKKEPLKSEIEVRFGNEAPLTKADYEIVGYQNNILKGTGKVTIRGINEYGGTKTVTFKIGAKTLTGSEKK